MAVGELNMASHALGLVLTLLFAQQLQSVFGSVHRINCEEIPIQVCAYSVSSSGNRCLLERNVLGDGTFNFQCQSSGIMAEKIMEWIETDECLGFCGLERMSLGVSTDSLLESHLVKKLCSDECQKKCPNIVDLYQNIAAGEGINLPNLCGGERIRSRRMMTKTVKVTKSSNGGGGDAREIGAIGSSGKKREEILEMTPTLL